MKIIRNEEYRFTFEEISEFLKEKIYENEKFYINSKDDLSVQHDEQGNFVVHHNADDISC
jgi:uncharacterized protein YyaL (SSP411 family)